MYLHITAMRAGIVEINPLSVVPVIILLMFNPPEYVGAMLFCALLHEAGHLTAMKFIGVKAERIKVMLLGADIKMSGMCGYGGDMLIYSAGAAANLAGALSAYSVYLFVPHTEIMFIMISNLFYAVFNMLPIKGLDGGAFAEAALLKSCEPYTAWKICEKLSDIFIVLLFSFCLWTVLAGGTNFSLLFIVLYLFVGLWKK